jgi:hypothetical protein
MDLHRGINRARFGLAILGGISVLQIIWVMLGGDALKTRAIGIIPLIISIVIGFMSTFIGAIARYIPYRENNFKGAGKLSAAVLPLPPGLMNTIRSGTLRSSLNFASPRNTYRSDASSVSARSNAGRTDREGLMGGDESIDRSPLS